MAPDDDEKTIRRADLRDLVGVEEIREMLGRSRGEPISRTRAQVVVGSRRFPPPLIEHPPDDPRVRLWRRTDVEAWLDANRPGWRDSPQN